MRDIEQWRQVQVVPIGKEQTVARNESDEMLERSFDGLEVRKDICMIELEVINNRNLGQIMHKLAALIKKGGVVLIPFNDKPFAIGKPRALAQVIGHASDEEARLQTVMFENPGQQRHRRRLAMGAGNHQGAFAADEEMLE